jgi:hypothetical protein
MKINMIKYVIIDRIKTIVIMNMTVKRMVKTKNK